MKNMNEYMLNGKNREFIKTMNMRATQRGAIEAIKTAIGSNNALILNMPCRTGKTFMTCKSAYDMGIELLVVVCGKCSAKDGYSKDSAWMYDNQLQGFDAAFTNNEALREFLKNPSSNAEKILVEVTPQLLGCDSKTKGTENDAAIVNQLYALATGRRTMFVFDEAHFAEGTENTREILNNTFKNLWDSIPRVYLSASPDTESLQLKKSSGVAYYELTKEEECGLYDTNRQDFDYVPVRNSIYMDNTITPAVFNTHSDKAVDYTALFAAAKNAKVAKDFVRKAIISMVSTIKSGAGLRTLDDEEYSMRGNSINIMIRLPKNPKNTGKDSTHRVGPNAEKYILEEKGSILAAHPEFTNINVKDVTGDLNCGEDEANAFVDNNEHCINIILTKKRLIEGTTIKNLDGFAYWANQTSMAGLKQETGRTLTPSNNKHFGFIFFFDSTAMSVCRMLLQELAVKRLKNKDIRKLTKDDTVLLTKIIPTFLRTNDGFKMLDYNEVMYSKTLLETASGCELFFDRDVLLAPAIRALIMNLLSTSKLTAPSNSEGSSKKHNDDDDNDSNKSERKKSEKVDEDTPIDKITLDKFIQTVKEAFQECLNEGIDNVDELSSDIYSIFEDQGMSATALTAIYTNDTLKDNMTDMFELIKRNFDDMNEEDCDD